MVTEKTQFFNLVLWLLQTHEDLCVGAGNGTEAPGNDDYSIPHGLFPKGHLRVAMDAICMLLVETSLILFSKVHCACGYKVKMIQGRGSTITITMQGIRQKRLIISDCKGITTLLSCQVKIVPFNRHNGQPSRQIINSGMLKNTTVK